MAESKKEQGNQHYKLKHYSKALAYYSEAIDLCPENAAYYGNRSACYLMQNSFKEALEDGLKSVSLDPSYVKGWIRVCKSYIALGDLAGAENALSKVAELEPSNSGIKPEMESINNLKGYTISADKAYAKGDYRTVVYFLDCALGIAKVCPKYKVLKAECLARLGRYQEAQELANDVLSTDKQNTDAILIRGICLYYQDNVDRAFSHFLHILKLAPDHKKALEIYKKAKLLKQKKEAGNQAFKEGRNQEAYDLYSEALVIDPDNKSTNAKLFFNRATVCSKLGKLNDAVSDCSAALELEPGYQKAILRRAKCYMDLQKYEEAVQDYDKAYKLNKNNKEVLRLLKEAKTELKKSKRKDYYKILGIDKNASAEDITKAYRKRALDHHPDRHVNATEGEKKEQEMKFKEVGEAYGILSDPQKKARYDSGQDIEGMGFCDDMGGGVEIDPNIFQAFFAPGSYPFSFGGFH